jgi:ABC-type multidrug transport system fused ATPase/permease subunit
MKAKNSFLSAPFTLKLVGFILVFASLLDYLFLLTGIDFKDKPALVNGMSQLVNQGTIPLVGIAFVMAAYWLERLADLPTRNSKPFRLLVLLVSAVLGIMFLILAPVHLNSTSQSTQQVRAEVEKKAKDAEGEVEQRIQQRQNDLVNLVKDPKRLDEQLKQMDEQIKQAGEEEKRLIQAVESKAEPESKLADFRSQLAQFKQLAQDLKDIKSNPGALQDKAKKSRDEALNEIRSRKQKADEQLSSQPWKASLKVALNSLILSVGYLIISWVGLSEMGLFSGESKARRAPKP